MAAAKEKLGKPFPQEEEYRIKSVRLAELDVELNMDSMATTEPEAKKGRPSVKESLKVGCRSGNAIERKEFEPDR